MISKCKNCFQKVMISDLKNREILNSKKNRLSKIGCHGNVTLNRQGLT